MWQKKSNTSWCVFSPYFRSYCRISEYFSVHSKNLEKVILAIANIILGLYQKKCRSFYLFFVVVELVNDKINLSLSQLNDRKTKQTNIAIRKYTLQLLGFIR